MIKSIYINKVESGLPRWLVEVGFVLFVIQSVYTETNIYRWVAANGLQPLFNLIILLGDLILYYGVMRGMKNLERPFKILWWIFLIVIVAGDVAFVAPDTIINMVLAVAAPLVFLPLGFAIAFFYRGWLQWVGILMVLHMVTMIVLPVMLFGLAPFIVLDVIAAVAQIALGWAMRKVLV